MMANGCALRVADTGGGDTAVLLLHGYLQSLDTVDSLTYALGGGLRILSLDIPGHGISQVVSDTHDMAFLADTVADVLGKTGVRRVIAVGHTLGAHVACELACRHAGLVAGLVLINALPGACPQTERDLLSSHLEMLSSGRKESLAEEYVSALLGSSQRMSEVAEELMEQAAITEDDGIRAVCGGLMAREDRSDDLRKAGVPVCLILGTEDSISGPVPDTLSEDFPAARTLILAGSGHACFIDHESECADAVRDFAARYL